MHHRNAPAKRKHSTSLFLLFLSFLKIGILTLGGGLAMMSVLHYEIVSKKKWLKEKEFMHILSLATAVPGAIAVNMAFLIGKKYAGIPGIILSLLGIILPSFSVILVVAAFFQSYFSYPVVQHFFYGASAAVVALIAFSLVFYVQQSGFDVYNIFVAAVFFLVLLFFGIHPIFVITASTAVRYFLPHRKDQELQ